MFNKFEELQDYLKMKEKQGICLAFSGGIDSILLLYFCKKLNPLAVTINSNLQTHEEISFTEKICQDWGIKQIILDTDIFKIPEIISNPKDRCYHCKKNMFGKIVNTAGKNGASVIFDGTNFDDLQVYRPGRKALEELGIISPFAMFKITKSEIREYSKKCNIPFYDKPSTPCLATRFPYETVLTPEKLKMVEKCEKVLKNFGFASCRFRVHNDIARIEILPENFNDFIRQKDEIINSLRFTGLKYITLDMEGLRSGSMD